MGDVESPEEVQARIKAAVLEWSGGTKHVNIPTISGVSKLLLFHICKKKSKWRLVFDVSNFLLVVG